MSRIYERLTAIQSVAVAGWRLAFSGAVCLGAAMVLAGAAPAAAQAPTIAAAANLNFALTEIAEQFARAQGTRVELVFGASGTLTRQIQDGAPFEMFLAADEEFPQTAHGGRPDARRRRRVRRRPAGAVRAERVAADGR